MKITGTKKLLISLLSLSCIAAAGLGVLFGGFSNAPKVYAQSEQHVLPVGDEEVMLKEFSADSGIPAEWIKFYALSNNGTIVSLYQYYLTEKEAASAEILEFMSTYSTGMLTNTSENGESIEEEDWYISPDEVSSYTFTGCYVGIVDTWDFLTSKSFITTEEEYWRESNFQWGHLLLTRSVGTGVLSPVTSGKVNYTSNNYFNYTSLTAAQNYWDNFWVLDIVWVDEGETFQFGVNSSKYYSDKYLGAMDTEFFIDNYLVDKSYSAYYKYLNVTYTGVYRGLFSDKDDTNGVSDSDPALFGYDSSPKTMGDYKDEFGSKISPLNAGTVNGQKSAKAGNQLTTRTAINSSFITWSSEGRSAEQFGSGYTGKHIAEISADAPSGVYYMGFFKPYANSYWSVWISGLTTGTSGKGTLNNSYGSDMNGWTNWSYYYNYGVMLCRKQVTAPEAEYGEGVSSNLRDKTINYSGEPATFTLKNDWGPGLTTVEVQQKINGVWTGIDITDPNSNISATTSYVDANGTTITCSRADFKGKGIQGQTTYTAQNAGEYRIIYTPFRNWSDGTTGDIIYNFTIKPMKLTKTTLVQEEGVTQATNTKYLYATPPKELFVSLYPVPQKWTSFSWVAAGNGSLSDPPFNYSSNGVLTLSGVNQDVYTITVKLKDKVNTAWDDGTADGSTADLIFTFEIGPEKVTVPDIIQDTGNIGANKKEVTFNGATQSMSFMPINPEQLDITVFNRTAGEYLIAGQDYDTPNNTLTVNAFDAGEYEIKIAVKSAYIFENITKEVTFELIIHEAEITAPILDEPTAVNYIKTVTYGGEKITTPDGIVQDWVATLTFQNADEARITPVLNGLGQQTWGDSTLVLAARAAGTYSVTFTPKKNYKWKSGETVREYTLIIQKLPIAAPLLVNDGEQGATFTSTSKSIGFGGEHTFSFEFPTLEASKNTPYTKKSSVYIIRAGGFEEVWNAAGDVVTFTGENAGTYTFTITPTNNYCWADGSTKDIIFTFKIIPVNIDALHVQMSDYLGGNTLVPIDFNKDEMAFRQIVSYDGTKKTVQIGNVGATDSEHQYITDEDDTYAKYFALLNENGTIKTDGLWPNMTAKEENGLLTITAIDAGTYRIAVFIRNTNFWWTETASTMIEYRLIIEAQGIPQPTIDESKCLGDDIIGHFEKNTKDGVYSMNGVYSSENFLLSASLKELLGDVNLRNYVTIVDPNGNEYVYDSTLHDSNVTQSADLALKDDGEDYTNPEADPQKRVYTAWFDDELRFYAKNQGTYTWKVKIENTQNYKWSGTNNLELSFTIIINRAPVSGLEMHYVGDKNEAISSDGIIVENKTNVRGSDSYATTVKYDTAVFSDLEKQIFIQRTNTKDLVNTGFSTQFSYNIVSHASWDDYDVEDLKKLDSNGVFNDEKLVLYALDAGKYEIILSLNDNYCWNDTGKTTEPVMFTLVINKCVLEQPVIIDDDDTKHNVTDGGKETTFNHEYQTFRLYMKDFPQGYAIGSFLYQDNQDRTGADIEPVRITPGDVYPMFVDPSVANIPDVTIGVDKDNHTLAVQAKSAGEYILRVVVSNQNNYEFNSTTIGSSHLQYTYTIKKLKVELPTAYLSAQNLTSADAEKKILDYSEVSKQNPGVEKLFESATAYTVNTEFNGKYHTVYLYGDDVAKGDFSFSVTAKNSPATSEADIVNKIIQPETVLVDNTTDSTQEAGYFMLAAQLVDVYEITLTFVTKDFYWSTDPQEAPSNPRTFTFVISKNNIEVPRIKGHENDPMASDGSFTATHTYALDGSTANGALARSATIENVMLGEKLTSTTPGVFVYSNITVSVSSLTTAGHVILNVDETNIASGNGDITFTTSSDGTVADGALVTRVYCIELTINTQNSQWAGCDENQATIRYYIKITKMQVTNPALDSHDPGDLYNKTVTYYDNSSDRWPDALILNKYDNFLMGYSVSANIDATNDVAEYNIASGSETAGFVTPSMGKYEDIIKISTDAGAGKYTLTIKLSDTDNTEWASDNSTGGGIADLDFNFVISPMKVAKPYIETSSGDTTVIGFTKTVTYLVDSNYVGVPQSMRIGNYWDSDASHYSNVVIPDIMAYTVAGTLNTGYPQYAIDSSFVPGTTSIATGAMKYNLFNNGWITIEATNAGKYVLTFALSDNAVWSDSSTEDIDVTFVIKKIEVSDLKIINADPSEVNGNTKTVTYNIDNLGNEVVYTFDLEIFDKNIMNVATLLSGRNAVDDGAGYLKDVSVDTSGNYTLNNGTYKFEASKADTYEIQFQLTDGANYRWKYADTDVITFYFVINKLQLNNPVLYDGYRVGQENINVDDRTLEVAFDLREHTILVKSLYEENGNPKQSTPYSSFGATNYFKVENSTAYNGTDFTQTTHQSQDKAYDNMNGITAVDKLFEILGVNSNYSYDGPDKGVAPQNFVNLFTLTAYTPGEYSLTFTIENTDNMVWMDGTTAITYKLIINKYTHAVPATESGDPLSKEYTAEDVNFTIVNAYNGVETSGAAVTATASEQFILLSYTGNDAALNTAIANAQQADLAANTDANMKALSAQFQSSWFGGRLTLKFTSVGVYVIRVSITDTNNISWDNTSATYKDFTFTVLPRTLTFDYKYIAKNNDEVKASLATLTSSDTPSWPLSTQVDFQITIKGLRGQVSNLNAIDSLLGFEIYYEDPTVTPLVKESSSLYDSINTNGWMASTVPQEDGTFVIVLTYSGIPFGQGNIAKGTYVLHIVQDTDLDPATINYNANPSNYTFADPQKVFVIEPDPAPFKGHEDMLTWSYSRDDWPAGTAPKLIENIGLTPTNRFTDLEYRPGVTYSFYVGLNAKGMAGYNTPSPAPTSLLDALATWQVKVNVNTTGDVIYGGVQSVTDAGDYSVSVTIEALDPNQYAYASYTFTLYYTIKQAKLDLSSLGWDYDGSQTFEFDGTAKTVNVTGLSSYGTDLMIDRYETVGSFVTYTPSALTPTPVTYTVSAVTSNSMTYAGKYTTKVYFKVPTPSNYALPSEADGTSYTGTFVFSVNWEITPQEIEVEWLETLTSSSDGDTVTKTSPVIAAPYTTFFSSAYIYEKLDSDGVTWLPVSAITRVPGTTLKYKATANLNSTPSSPSTDYARNYTFKILGQNPLEFEVGGDDTEIVNHIEVSGTKTNGDSILPVTINNVTVTTFEYTGNAFTAANVIDLDTTNGLINSMTVTLLYYNASDLTLPISAPSEVGSYVVKVKLSYTGTTEDYAFAISEAKFEIVKAKIKYSDFEWHFTHNDGEDNIEAKWDAVQGKWINIANNEEVKLEYDGHSYELYLSSDYASTVISILYDGNSGIDAGDYEATLLVTIDTNHYEIDASDPIPDKYSWKIAKHFLDLSKVTWDYSKAYEYTIVNGTPKTFKVELTNLPEYLLDKIVYTTIRVNENDTVPQTGDIYNAGTYETTVDFIYIDTDEGRITLIDYDNYDLDNWPVSPFSTTLSWTINRKEMELPANDASWTEFDGIQHNLLKPFQLDVDWNEYFDIDVTYAALGSGDAKPYDGTSSYGGKYYAYDAGVYSFILKIKTDFNKDNANIVWVVRDGAGFKKTDDNQTVSYTVNKKALKVIGWNKDYESSTVILSSGIDPSKFIEYDFYKGNAGAVLGQETDLDTILDSAGGDIFSMVAVVKGAYDGNITIAYDGTGDGYEFIWFETQQIDQTNAKPVGDKPYIYGYSVDGTFHRFTSAELAAGAFVIYAGKQVEFKIYDWDTKYSQYLTVWNGSLDDLKQTEAGQYSITLILRKDLEYPLYWGVKDGKVDRSSVTLTFEIRYRTLTIPDIPEEIVYSGTTINILDKATNAKLSDLMAEYGDYVTITGNTATNVGEQMLYLAIKDEYGNAVRWSDGSVGTYSVFWKITPILLYRPERNTAKTSVEYDGTAHTVYEFLVGYDPENIPQSIKDLIKYVNATNAEGINADTYSTTLSLPNDNFAWCDSNGNKLADRSSFKCDWTIDRQYIDFSKAYWGYWDGDEPVAYDSDKPFVYAVVNGAAKYYTLQIMGMPEILKLYATYTTNGVAGNSACKVDTYKTRVEFNLSALENNNNYIIGTELDDGLSEISWQIVPRELELPEPDDSWSVFDGEVHDLITEILGLDSDWSDYFNIKVEYKVLEGDDWADYKGEDKLVVGFSNYKVYDFGFYRITVTLKASEPTWIPNTNIMWKDGNAPEAYVLQVQERTVLVTGWFEDNEYSYALFEEGTLPAGIEAKLEYLIYNDDRDENGELKKVPVDIADIKDSTTYYMELKFKDGTDEYGVKYTYGVTLVFDDGVRNPYEFGKFNFMGQSIIWLPIPVLEDAVLEYNGEKQTFVIKDFDTLYKMTDAQRLQLNSAYNLNLSATTNSFVYLQDTKSLTVTAAGEYTAVVRLLGKVYLSWYDSDKYYASADGKTLYEIGSVNPVSDPDSLYDSQSVILKFTVTPKQVPALTVEELEKLLGLVVSYDGTEKDVTAEAQIFAELEAKYGKIFGYEGNTGTAADIYHLIISLADNDSCSWYNPDEKEEIVKQIIDLGGYRAEYVLEGGVWKLAVVKVDADGNTVMDSAKMPVEYFDADGGYNITVEYQHKFEMEYVLSTNLLDSDGKPDYDNNINNFLTKDGSIVYYDNKVEDGNEVRYEYVLNADGTAKTYDLISGEYVESATGTYVLRYKLSVSGEKDFGYKLFAYEDATEYTYMYSKLTTLGANGKPLPVKGIDGNYITKYVVSVPAGYELREYVIGSDGEFVIDVLSDAPKYTVLESACELVDSNFYSIVNGRYVTDTNGAFILRYVLKADGTREQAPAYEVDENGNYVINQDRSSITVIKYAPATGEYVIEEVDGKISITQNDFDGLQYKVDWMIDSSVLAIPEFDETLMQEYTGKTLYAKDVLKGFIPDLMTIEEGSEGIKAGEYTAKIVITTPNSKWNPDVTEENYVYVKWRIDTAKLDLKDVKWSYNDGTNTYEDSSQFVYTRKNGNPVVYWVELANLPVALQDRVIYTTNKVSGAYAGINVGKYVTSFSFDIDENFETVEIPETLETEITWSISRRMLQIPELTSVYLVFDNTPHDLLELLGVPEDWNEYFDIDVKYSNGGEYVAYKGIDGNPYVAYNSGAYMFTFTIKSGINTSASNPNVAWLISVGEEEAPDEDIENPDVSDTEGDSEDSDTGTDNDNENDSADSEDVGESATDTVAYVSATALEQQAEQTAVKSEAIQALEQVCDTIKKLVCGAEVQMKSFRKYSTRGTL